MACHLLSQLDSSLTPPVLQYCQLHAANGAKQAAETLQLCHVVLYAHDSFIMYGSFAPVLQKLVPHVISYICVSSTTLIER